MLTCHRFTSIATLIIGLQVLSSTLIDFNREVGISHKLFSTSSLIASTPKSSSKLSLRHQSNQLFTPPDNGGPDITQGSGTR